MLPIGPYVVLDQNAFRDERQLAPAIADARERGLRLLILDVAMIEMTKHPSDWEITVRKSLRFVADHPELVVVGRGIPDLFRIEKASGQPSIADLGWPELTDSFRRLLNELRQNKDGTTLRSCGARLSLLRRRLVTSTWITRPTRLAFEAALE